MSETAGWGFLPLALLLLSLLTAGLTLHLRGRWKRAQTDRIAPRAGGDGVPLVAAFSGWKGMPWISFASSDLAPSLILHADHLACRVLKTRRKPYAAVSRVDYRETVATTNIVLEFSDSPVSFTGNTANRDTARAAIRRLAEQGCPLSPRAQDLVRG
ncbi:MAG: hypothetical protein AB1592_09830 [Pseudomonadota bacterium]